MNQVNKLLSEYVEVEARFKALEDVKQDLRGKILEAFKKEKIDKMEDPTLGTFSIAHKTTWTYSPAVKTLEGKVKIAKIKEQEKGIAKSSESNYLLYNKPKENATD
jgi:hypothetical protein